MIKSLGTVGDFLDEKTEIHNSIYLYNVKWSFKAFRSFENMINYKSKLNSLTALKSFKLYSMAISVTKMSTIDQ